MISIFYGQQYLQTSSYPVANVGSENGTHCTGKILLKLCKILCTDSEMVSNVCKNMYSHLIG